MTGYKMSEQNTSVKPHEFYKEYYSGFNDEEDIAEFKEIDINLNDYPNNVPEEEYFAGSWMITDINHFYLIHNNTIEENKNDLNQCKKIMKLISPALSGEDIKQEFKSQREKIPLLSKILKDGFCVTPQLLEIFVLINEGLEKIVLGVDYCKVTLPHPDIEFLISYLSNPSTISFDSFTLDMDHVIDLVKKNERWQKLDRDLSIYFERKKGRILQDIADDHNIVFTAVSRIDKKVRGAINYYKGKLFEDFVEMRLKSSGLFDKIIKEAGKGESDIRVYKDDKLYIYSLKNLKIDRNPYWLITKEELLPELKDSKLSSLDYNTTLILIVYDNFHDKIKQTEIDYNAPENINLSII